MAAIDADTEFRAGYQFATVDFHDSFPNFTIYQPNFTGFPIFDMSFKKRFNERHSLEVEGCHRTNFEKHRARCARHP